MSKFLVLADTHAGVRLDDPRFDAAARRFFTNGFFPYARHHGIKTILHVGDMFDRRKTINFQTLKSMREYLIEPIVDLGAEILVIPGNHDVFHKNTNALSALNLLLREYADTVKILSEPTDIRLGNNLYACVPWICDENETAVMNFIDTTTAKVCFGHFEIEGFAMQRGMAHVGGIKPSVLKKFDAVYSGHFHHRHSKGNITYLGCPYEMTWLDYDDPKGFHVYDTDTDTMEFVLNPETMHDKIYYDDTEPVTADPKDYAGKIVKLVAVKKTDPVKFDALVAALETHGVSDLKILEDLSAFEATGVDDAVVVDDTATLLNRFVDEVDVPEGISKDAVKLVLSGLFVEAQHREI